MKEKGEFVIFPTYEKISKYNSQWSDSVLNFEEDFFEQIVQETLDSGPSYKHGKFMCLAIFVTAVEVLQTNFWVVIS